ncbi:MAG: GNAT family N-acetyltransferase [Acidobacteriales bacterium]|nr:GNAT family N-acetyltransferase [Terriglobales bacterium]
MLHRPQILRTPEEIAAIEPLWNQLHHSDPHATVFQSFAWNLALATHLSDREQPYVIVTEDTIIPAALTPDAVTFLGENLADYRACLTSAPESDGFNLAWKALAALDRPLRFTALRPEHHSVFDRFSTTDFTGAPYAHAPAQEFASKHNRMFSRLRKLERLGFHVTTRDPRDRQFLSWMYERKAAADSGGLFHDPARVQCLLDIYAATPDFTELTTIEREGHVIAAAIALRDRQTLRFYTNWFDPEWSHYSPGMVLLYEISRRALALGLTCDYLTGDQPYKMRMATGVSHLRRLDATLDELRAL